MQLEKEQNLQDSVLQGNNIALNKVFPSHHIGFSFSIIPILFLIFLLLTNSSFAQSKKNLQQQKQKIEQEINYASSLLKKVRKSKKTSYNEFVLVKKQIKSREALIRNINNQYQEIKNQITRNSQQLKDLNSDLEVLREEYARVIYNAYKTRNPYNKLMFVFASEDFNQAFRRFKYLQQYSEYRKKQVEDIEATQVEIQEVIEQLEVQKEEQKALLAAQNVEKKKLLDEKKKKDEVVKTLSKKEKELRKKIKENEKTRKRLARKIQKLIADEIAKANKKSGKKASKTFALTPEELALSDNFSNNKGKLPWPVERGIISENFGEHAHEFLKHVKVNNRGINIISKEGTKARAVFDGTVSVVMKMEGYHTLVMIKHGNYITVYANLTNVTVKKGDKVKTKQNIGTIYTSVKDSKTELHFELWKNKKLNNPKTWLAPKR